MEKKKYVKPTLNSEEFVPQEYIAACHDQNLVYKFECNAGPTDGGDVWLETNGKPGLQKTGSLLDWYSPDKYLGGYHPCGKQHEAKTTDEFFKGYLIYDDVQQDVIVWRGPYKNNTHCTDQLDENTWETAKS